MNTEITIYLLEDNEDDVYLFKQIINTDDSCKYTTIVFDSVAGIERTLQNIIPDLLIVDLNIPESFGLQTLRDVKEVSQDIPIIVLTGSDETLGLQAIQLGAQDYLLKGEIHPQALKEQLDLPESEAFCMQHLKN
ncbi:response regulator [Paraglaciecola aquimarina]|uniref:Response regulator n=1 Tax=Paraglaciecola aquimarina TaxID=1235557 RepID=A0ABU3ST25_9ALTE|nr:response regulator [Paraglaciecola aquimarina]MDU0353133.1 response regulator [Paraglaciecola aquimarina]